MARILIVEDDEQLRGTLGRLLTRAGYQVGEAGNGQIALKKMSDHPADLVVMDMVMPEMEGVELLLALRRYRPTPKVLAISGGGVSSADNYLKIAEVLGAHKAMSKPLDPRVFLQVVNDLLPMAPS